MLIVITASSDDHRGRRERGEEEERGGMKKAVERKGVEEKVDEGREEVSCSFLFLICIKYILFCI